MTIGEVVKATHGVLLSDESLQNETITSIETDSRSVLQGGLFIPLIGERLNGHEFIQKALENGAKATLTSQELNQYDSEKIYIRVEDTTKALGDLAKYYRKKFPIKFIAVTGSVGKTTTKDMISSVLAQKMNVIKTEGNFNNEIGLPLTLFRLDEKHDVCVLEMGMSSFGEIEYLGHIVEPQMAVITNIGDAHIETLGSYENILKAKCEIFETMSEDAQAILNGDNPLLRGLQQTLSQGMVYYGADDQFSYRAFEIETNGNQGVRCMIQTPIQTFRVQIPALGRHMVYAVLAATIVAEQFGMDGTQIAKGVEEFIPTKMRMNVVSEGDITILDDAYNANPQSMRAAIEVLAQSDSSYKVAILGDMFELGELAQMLHYGVGEYIANAGIDCLIAIGDLAKQIYEGASNCANLDLHYFKTKEEAETILPTLIKSRANILVKASRGMEFEDVVRMLQRYCLTS